MDSNWKPNTAQFSSQLPIQNGKNETERQNGKLEPTKTPKGEDKETGGKRGRPRRSDQPAQLNEPTNSENSEPRSKRSRSSTQHFQSSMVDQIQQIVAVSARQKNQQALADGKVVLYEKGEYLAVRCDDCEFFVCKALQNIYKSSKKIKIYWLNNEGMKSKDLYQLDFTDTIERETILTNLTMKKSGPRMELPAEERIRTLNILKRAIQVQNGELPPPDPKALTKDGLDVSLVTVANNAVSESEPDTEKADKPVKAGKKRGRKPGRRKSTKSKDETDSEDDEVFAEVIPVKTPKKEPKPLEPGIIYQKGDFLAVRNESSGFYLCKALTNIHEASKTFRMHWLNSTPDDTTLYVLDYCDTIETRAILTKVEMARKNRGRLFLSTDERRKAQTALAQALKKDSNGFVEDTKKSSVKNDKREPPIKDRTSDSPPGMKLTIRRIKDDHASSLLATDIPEMERDPLWDDNNPEGGAVSPSSDATDRLLGCLLQRDHIAIRKLITSGSIWTPHAWQSVHVHKTCLDYAVEAHDVASIRLLLGKDSPIKTCKKETNLLRSKETERNKKEGNGALLKDLSLNHPLDKQDAIKQSRKHALEIGVTLDVLEELLDEEAITESSVILAMENGNYELARSIVVRLPTQHVLLDKLFGNVPLEPKDLHARLGPNNATMFHLLVAQPGLQILLKLLNSSQKICLDQTVRELITKRDNMGKLPMHYAATSKSRANLEWLVSRGANLQEVDNEGNTALHIIAFLGRVDSLKFLVKLKEGSSHPHFDETNRRGQSPLHVAIMAPQPAIVERLLAFGADANKPLGSHSDRVTPLMLAAQRGNHLGMVRNVLRNADKVDTQDKRGRSALIHAAMNGHTAAACLLLRHGANAHLTDTSGNSALHYAAAYGHLFVVKLLVEIANLSPAQVNDAKMCSLEVAFRKGHIGLVKYMLGLGCFARGFDCGLGESLLASCVELGDLLEPTQVARFEVLLKSCPQLSVKTDPQGNNLLHRVVHMEHRVMLQQLDKSSPVLQEHQQCLQQAVDLILGLPVAGNAISAVNKEKETPISLSLSYGCLWLAARYARFSPMLLIEALKSEKNLKKIASNCVNHDATDLMAPVADDVAVVENLKILSRNLLQKNINLLMLTLNSIQDEELSWKITNACAFIEYLFSRLSFDPAGPVLHAAVRCKSTAPLKIILSSVGSMINYEFRQNGLTALQEAVMQGNSGAVLLLVQHGSRTELMMPPSLEQPALPLFLYCCLPGRPFRGEVIRAIASSKTPDLIAMHPISGDTALHFIVKKKHWHIEDKAITIDSLIKSGLSAASMNARKQTPLHLAAENNTTAEAQIELALIKAGAPIDGVDLEGRLPLHYLFMGPSAERDPIEVCKVLLTKATAHIIDTTVDRAESQTVLHYAASAGATLCCGLLLSMGASLDIRNKNDNTATALAVLRERSGAALALIEKGNSVTDEVCVPPSANVPSNQLIWRHVYPKQGVVCRKTLLQAVFEIGKRDIDYYMNTSDDSEQAIEQNEAEPKRGRDSVWTSLIPGILIDQLQAKSLPISLAVDAAVRAENYELALKLLTRVKHGWTLTLIARKQTMLHLVAQQKYSEGQLKVAQALLNKEVAPHSLDEHGCSALTYANVNWNHKLAEFIIEKIGIENAAQQAIDRSFRTPLSAIFWRMEMEPIPEPMLDIALRLIAAGATINILSCYPVRNLEFPGTICVSENVMHVTHSAAARISPLIMAVCKKNHAAARFLLREAGADPNFADAQSRTALMYAVKLNDLSMAKLILNYDYDVEKEKFSNHIKGCITRPDVAKTEEERIDNFVPTTNINLAHRDIFGWSLIHHIVAPLPEMTYAATHMLRLLARADAPLEIPDRNAIQPLSLGAARGVESITLALQDLIKADPMPEIVYHNLPPILDDGVIESVPIRDFRADSDKYEERLSRRNAANGSSQDVSSGGNDVDPFGLMDWDEWTIVTNSRTRVPYDVLLTKLDSLFIYSFSKIQLVTSNDRTRFMVMERTGRIGDVGSVERTAFSIETEAVREFERLFRARTEADFEESSTLRPVVNKFRPVAASRPHKEKLKEEPARVVIDALAIANQRSKLAQPLQDLFKTIIKTCASAPPVPSDDRLRQAMSILEEMRHLAGEKKQMESDSQKNENQLVELMLRLAERSHTFHALLPPGQTIIRPGVEAILPVGLEQMEPLWTEQQIEEQVARVYNYLDLQLSRLILQGSLLNHREINPIDYIYRATRCKVQLLQVSSIEMQTVLQYIHNSSRHQPLIRNIYRVSRECEEETMANGDIKNHWLLWHPVEQTSILAVMHRGLQAVPLGKEWPPQSKGLKFYDRFIHENFENASEITRFELLCQVALGDEGGKPGRANGGHSVKLRGRWGPDEFEHVSWQSCTVPVGMTVFNADQEAQHRPYNEYVVYKPEQACIRYLIEWNLK